MIMTVFVVCSPPVEEGCQWDPGVKGRVELLVSELLLCLNRKGEAEQILLQAENTLTQVS